MSTLKSEPPAVAPHPGEMELRVRVYLWLSAVFVTCLLLANIIGVKLFSFDLGIELGGKPFNLEHTTGMLTFPVTFLITDLLNEYYGKRGARRVTYIGFAMAAVAYALIWVSRQFPILEVPGTATHASYENIFGAAAMMYIASLVAFLVGSLLDIFIFGVFKRLTRGKMVWLRATGSTVISQVFDSLIVTSVFFWFMPMLMGGKPQEFAWVLKTAATGYMLKFVLAVLLTPFIYLGRWTLRERFGLTPVPADSRDV
jgi:queuosine precursor transporter